MKDAVIVVFPLTVRVAGLELPVKPPLHPVKLDSVDGVAVSVTTVPTEYLPPEGLKVTEPTPVPEVLIVTMQVEPCMFWVNVAVTAMLLLIVTVAGLADPVKLPPHPVKLHPVAGVAVN